MTNLDSILKSRDIPLSTKVYLVKAMIFLLVMYGCESWTIKKAECRKIDAFERWCWRRLLRVPWTARRSNQSILKEISPGCSLKNWYWSWNSNTLAIWCEKLTHLKRPWCWERLKAGGEGDNRGWDGLIGITNSMDMGLGKLQQLVMNRKAWRATVHRVAKSWTRLSNWTELNWSNLVQMHEGLPAPFLSPSPLREPPQVTLFLHHHDLPFAILEHSLTTTVHKSFVSTCAESAYKTNHDLCHSYTLCFLSEIAPGLIIFYYLQLIIFYYVSLFGGEWQRHAC